MTAGLSCHAFEQAFPFRFAIDASRRIVEMGKALKTLAPGRLGEELTALCPELSTDYPQLCAQAGNVHVLTLQQPTMQLRGQFLQDGPLLWFLGSPWLFEPEELATLGLTIRDFAAHDASPEVVMLRQVQRIATADAERATRRLRHLAYYDLLTNLPNRTLFGEQLERLLPSRSMLAMIVFDLDDFKMVNDVHGQGQGDQVLLQFAERLQTQFPSAEILSRLGGDEFAVILSGVHDEDQGLALGQAFHVLMQTPFVVGDQLQPLTVSMGVTLIAPSDRPADVLRRSDVALYRAKTEGKNRVAFYDDQLYTTMVQRQSLERSLALALARKELFVVYQPIVDLRTGEIDALEALVRWNDPVRGAIPPSVFVPAAEQGGLIEELSLMVFYQAMQDGLAWLERYPQLQIHVNTSVSLVRRKGLVGVIETLMERTGFPPQNLVIEVTESAVLGSSETVSSNLSQLRALGIPISIDDFGTGYSSLSQLHTLAPSSLKLDRSFVQTMESDQRLVEGVLRLSEALEVTSIAEGIETAEQSDLLMRMGWRYGQGYYFARPSCCTQIDTLLQTHSALLAA